MHHIVISRRTSLGALAALSLLIGALFATAPKASADLSQCPANAVCVWENSNYTGNFSQWAASDRGCHDHYFNPNLRSAYNRTGFSVQMGGWGNIPSGQTWSVTGGVVTGQICW